MIIDGTKFDCTSVEDHFAGHVKGAVELKIFTVRYMITKMLIKTETEHKNLPKFSNF